jgi:hypothetical protein
VNGGAGRGFALAFATSGRRRAGQLGFPAAARHPTSYASARAAMGPALAAEITLTG